MIRFLCGPPAVGKTSVAREIVRLRPETLVFGNDAMADIAPDMRPGIGRRPGGESPDAEPGMITLVKAYFAALAAFDETGFDIVADVTFHRRHAARIPWPELAAPLRSREVRLYVLDAPTETIVTRRIARGWPPDPDAVDRWRAAFADMPRDAAWETTSNSSREIATAILDDATTGAWVRWLG